MQVGFENEDSFLWGVMLCILVAMGPWAGMWFWPLTTPRAKVKERI